MCMYIHVHPHYKHWFILKDIRQFLKCDLQRTEKTRDFLECPVKVTNQGHVTGVPTLHTLPICWPLSTLLAAQSEGLGCLELCHPR